MKLDLDIKEVRKIIKDSVTTVIMQVLMKNNTFVNWIKRLIKAEIERNK